MFLMPLLTPKSAKKDPKQSIIENVMKNMPEPDPAVLVTRKQWNARKPKSKENLKTPVKLLVLKYGTSTPSCETREECEKIVQELQRRHMDDKGLPDIRYNFLVGADGNIYEGRGWKTKSEPYEVKDERYEDLHSKSVNVVFIGRWVEKPPLADMMSAVADLCIRGIEEGHLHEDFEVFEPSRLRKPIFHGSEVKVKSKREEKYNLNLFKEYE